MELGLILGKDRSWSSLGLFAWENWSPTWSRSWFAIIKVVQMELGLSLQGPNALGSSKGHPLGTVVD